MPDALASALATPGLIWLLCTVLAAGLVRGFAGFGSALIIMPVASSVLDPVAAVLFLTIVELLGPVPNVPSALRQATLGDIARLGLGAAVALPLGLYGLSHMSHGGFGWLVSCVVLVLLAALMAGWRYRGPMSPPLIFSTGALGGFMGGAVGLAGPPVILLYMASVLPVAVIRANFLLYLLLIDILMVTAMTAMGLLVAGPIVVGALLIVPYMLANAAGALLFNPEQERLFRAVAYAVIAASALAGLPVWSERG